MLGSGTIDDPYIIIAKSHLSNMSDNLTAYYRLGNDIDLENMEWMPIGTQEAMFKGSLDGNGYSIKNLYINKPTVNYIGLFACAEKATIKNLTIENVDITGNGAVGSLIGIALTSPTTPISIENCRVTGQGSVNGNSTVGGLIGASGFGNLVNCSSTVDVNGKGTVGGLVGSISPYEREYGNSANMTRCYTTGNVTSQGSNAGGLIGHAEGNISQSYATGNVTGIGAVGGLIGNIRGAGSVAVNTYSQHVSDCFALGDVTGQSSVGGLIGNAEGVGNTYKRNINNCYSAGKVIGESNTGGLIGIISDNLYYTVNNCYYDGIASGDVIQQWYYTSKLTSGMKVQATYTNWNFTGIWGIDEGNSYPYLLSLPVPDEVSQGLPTNDVAGGKGIVTDPYIIATIVQLNNMRYDLTAHYKLGNDIDLENVEWTPVGTYSASFKGSLDGDGYTIRNLTIDKPTVDYIGLFGYINGGTIKNLTLENASISGKSYVGVIAASCLGNISNCKVIGTGSISGVSGIGGISGSVNGSMTKCSSILNVTGTGNGVGGLFGSAAGTISNCYATGNVTTTGSNAGGLIGSLSGNMNQSYATGDVIGNQYVGGLVGYAHTAGQRIQNSFALGNVKANNASSAYAGGLIGDPYGTYSNPVRIETCYSIGSVSGNGTLKGGLVGRSDSSYATIVNSYYDGIASGYIPQQTYDTSKLTSGMKAQGTYANWNFTDIWGIDEGNAYPYLLGLPIPDKVSQGLPVDDVAGGKGTATDPYIITTRAQLNNMRYDLTAHYKLGNDIDLENVEWTPVGVNISFKGSLNGVGYTIRNLSINEPEVSSKGLMGFVENATVKNLTIENVNIVGKSNTGALVGTGNGTNIIENCKVTGTGSVSGSGSVGGIAGVITGNITNCSSAINVNGTGNSAGGLIGSVSVSGVNITNCYTTGNVTLAGNNAGGLVGYLIGNVYQSYATGNVTGNQYIGGLVGYAHTPGQRIQNSFALGNVTSTNTSSAYAGGLVGEASSGISSNPVRIENCYSIGSVSGNGTLKGGLIGSYSSSYTSITSSYFDSTTTGITTPTAQARTTEQMIVQSNYTGWDFMDVWDMEEGSSYPYLRVLPVPPHVLLPDRLYPTGLAVLNATPNSITLKWNFVQDATTYEIEANNTIVYSGPATTFEHTSLESGTEYIYRARAKNDDTNMISSWSPRFKAMTLLTTPIVTASYTDTSATVTWNAVDKATSYEIEVDGVIYNKGSATAHTHTNLPVNSQHTYKVRAKNSMTKSAWTEIIPVINWASAAPGICLAANNWTKDINSKEDVTVTLKANNVSNMYTIQFELTYNPQILTLKTESITNLMGTEIEGMYIRTSEDKVKGTIKVLVSYTGNNQGKNGQLDVLSITFGRKSTVESSIKIEPVKIVKPSGEYIIVPQVSPLNIKALPDS